MTPILSKTPPAFDISAAGFTASAADVGEALALLAGGVKPDAETLSRLSLSLRGLQGFLMSEAGQQEAREVLARALASVGAADLTPRFPVTAIVEFGPPQGFPAPVPMTREAMAPIAVVA